MTAIEIKATRGWGAGAALAVAATLGLAVASAPASAAVLVSDSFDSAADGAALDGRSPDTGAHAWSVSGAHGADLTIASAGGDGEVLTKATEKGSAANIQFDPGTSGAYDHYTLQATVRTRDAAYVGLGFVNGTASFFTRSELTVTFRPNGRVVLTGPWDATAKSTNLADTGAVSGFDNTVYHDVELIYNAAANTASVRVDGIEVIAPVAVTDHNGDPYTPILKYGTFIIQNPVVVPPETASRARVDDFAISAVPEPGSMSLLTLGGLMLFPRREGGDRK